MSRSDTARVAVVLVWFEAVADGTAPSHALEGYRARLRGGGVADEHLTVVATAEQSVRWRLPYVLRRSLRELPRHDVAVVRWHPVLCLLVPVLWLWRTRLVLLAPGTTADALEAHPRMRRIPAVQWLLELPFRAAEVVVTPHAGLTQWVRDTVSTPAVTMPNGPPSARSVPSAATGRQAPLLEGDYVVFAGALAPWQGVPVLLAAVGRPAWPPGLQCVVVGSGQLGEAVDAAAAEGRVVAAGQLAPEVVKELLRGATAALSPKLLTPATARGTSPFKLLEAAMMGTPVVASRIPGQTEFVEEHGCGLLVDPGDPDALAEAVALLDADASLRARLGAAGLVAAEASAWERDGPRLVELLRAP